MRPRTERICRPGHPVTEQELRGLGFTPHELRIDRIDVPLVGGTGRNWETDGSVPDLPGLYAFTVIAERDERVTYVGLTTHLPMVTHGSRLGVSRPGQRHGRPKRAGQTRQRVNVCVTAEPRVKMANAVWGRERCMSAVLSTRPIDSSARSSRSRPRSPTRAKIFFAPQFEPPEWRAPYRVA